MKKRKTSPHIAIVGCVGVPAKYGGFETLAENLVRYHSERGRPEQLSVYCTARAYPARAAELDRANLIYSRLPANGPASVAYDAVTLRDAARRGVDVALMLGVSGAAALPLMRRRDMRVVAHVDGMEGQRPSWSAPTRAFLRWSEALAVRHADAVIADHPAIARRIDRTYGARAEIITYGGDQAARDTFDAPPAALPELPADYDLALCRIVAENNIEMILTAYANAARTLVFVGNWADSRYGRSLRARFAECPTLTLLDPIHDPARRDALRAHARAYVHGHSVGGTNPALVEMMHVGHPIFAFDCVYNRETTQGAARYFSSVETLATHLNGPRPNTGPALSAIARDCYRWDTIGAQYFDLFERMMARPR